MTTSYISRLGNAPEEGMKAPCVASTTANIALTAEQTIDSVAVIAGDRVLVRNQTTVTENGIYAVAVGAWTRTKDFNNANDVVNGVVVVDANSGEIYQAVFTGSWTPDTTSITFIGQAFSTKLSRAGDTATGQIKGITPVSAEDFTRKDYVDSGDASRLPLTGGTMTGQAKGITPVSAEDLTRKDYVDTADALKLNLSGGTLSGQVSGITPTSAAHLARKDYVDTMIPKAGGTATGQIKGITPVANEDLARKDYVDSSRIGGRVILATTTPMNIPSGAGSSSPIQWNTEDLDEISAHDNVTNNHRITVPADYNRIKLFVNVMARQTGAADETVEIDLKKNGVTIYKSRFGVVQDENRNSEFTTIWLDTTATSFYELHARTSGTSVDVILITGDSSFSAELTKV